MAENPGGGGGANVGGINYEIEASAEQARLALRGLRAEAADTTRALETEAQRSQRAIESIGRGIAQQAGGGRTGEDALRATERALGLPSGALGGGARGGGGGGAPRSRTRRSDEGGEGEPEAPPYTGPSRAFAELQSAGRGALNPSDQARLYAARRQQEALRARLEREAARERDRREREARRAEREAASASGSGSNRAAERARDLGLRRFGIETRDPAAGADGGGGGEEAEGVGGGGGGGRIRGFTLPNFVRFGAAAAGVGIGLSIAAAAGRALHAAIQAGTTAAEAQERLSRQISTNYQGAASQVQDYAKALASNAGGTAGPLESQRAFAEAGRLSTLNQLNPAQINQVLKRTQDFAAQTGNNFDTAFRSKVTSAIESGGDQLATYGVRLDDAYLRTQQFNSGLAVNFDRLTQQEKAAARAAAFLQQTTGAQGAAARSTDSMVAAQDRLRASTEKMATAIASLAGGPATAGINALARFIGLLLPDGSAGSAGPTEGVPQGPNGRRPLGPAPSPFAFNLPGVANSARPDLSGFNFAPLPGAPPDVGANAVAPPGERLADIFGRLAEQGGLAATALGHLQATIVNAASASPSIIRGQATERAEQALVSRLQAQQQGAGGGALRQQLNRASQLSTDPAESDRVRRLIGDLDALQGAYERLGASETAQAQARQVQTAGQQDLQAFQLRQSARQLDSAVELANVRQKQLGIEGEMAPLMVRQFDLQTRIALASRDNLALRQKELEAQRAALGPAAAVNDLEYQRQRILLTAQVRRAAEIQGKSTEGLPDLSTMFDQLRNLAYQQPALDLANLDAQQNVQEVGRQVQSQALDRAEILNKLEAENRVLTDELRPLEQRKLLAQQEADEIQRSIDIAAAGDEPERVRLQKRLDAIALLNTQSDIAVQSAKDYAQYLENAAAAAERIRTGVSAPSDWAPGNLGGYTVPTTAGGPPSPTVDVRADITINGFGNIDAVTQSVLDKLRPYIRDQLAGAARAAAANAAPTGVVGVGP